MITIQDVAKHAGVAPITVSRVVNKSGYVTRELRERVEGAVTELGYVPNSLARSLRSKRTNTIALVLTDVTNPFFTTIARGVEDAASDAGYMVVLCNTDEREIEEQKYLRMLMQNRVDGILLVPAGYATGSLDMVRKQGTAVVVIDRRIESGAADVVRCDSEEASYNLAKVLTDYNHTRLTMLTGPSSVSTSEDRVLGFRRAMSEADIPTYFDVLYGEFTIDSGYTMTRAAMASEIRPTALYAGNNFIGIGALRALRELGLRCPEDVSLVSFDDLPDALVTFPFLTVVAQPAYEMGRIAVQTLFQRLDGSTDYNQQCREVILPTRLICRHSAGPAPSS